jgi:hypothetical protein
MVSHPRRGGRRHGVLSRWTSASFALCRRVVLGARDRPTGEHSDSRPGERWRRAKRSGALDGPLIAAVFVVGVAVALVMTLF